MDKQTPTIACHLEEYILQVPRLPDNPTGDKGRMKVQQEPITGSRVLGTIPNGITVEERGVL